MKRALPSALLLLSAVICLAQPPAANATRRLLVACPDLESDQFGIELGALRSDVPLGNVVRVEDSNGEAVAWQLSPKGEWIVFDSSPGEHYEIVITPTGGEAQTRSEKPLPGMLTLSSYPIWLRETDLESRISWFSNRLSRVAGAVIESQDQATIDAAITTHGEHLHNLGVTGLTPSNPYDAERRLVTQETDVPHLLEQMLETELQARAAIFIMARDAVDQHKALRKSVNIAKIRPWDLADENSAAALRGRLHLTQTESVTFNIYSLCGGALRIDGRDVAVIRPLSKPKPDGWRQSVPLSLSAGPHDLEFITQGRRQGYQAGLTWVPPGESHERHMNASDFSPAPRAAVTGFVSADRSRHYPLVRLTPLGRTGFFDRARYWVTLESLAGELDWRAGSYEARGMSLGICARADTPISARSDGVAFTIALDEKQFRHLGESPAVRSEWPNFLFGTERLTGRTTLTSEAEIPLEIALQLQRTRPGEKSSILLDEQVSLGGRGTRIMLREAQTEHQSFNVALDGRELQPGDSLIHRAACPPERFADEIYRIIAPAACTDVGCDQSGRLINAAGERVIVRLSRPSLSDKRNWWLLRGAIGARAPRHLLVVAAPEEWGEEPFREALEAAGESRGIDIDLTEWETPVAGVSRLLSSLGIAARKLKSGEYDGLLLVPPLSDLAAGIDARTLSRALACVAEMGSGELGRQRVWIALPPSYRPEIPRSEPFERAMLRIIGDYGVQAVPLATWLESKPDALASAYEADGILQPGPVAMGSAIAEYLIAWICGDQI